MAASKTKKNNVIERSFGSWDTYELKKVFNLKKLETLPSLEAWINNIDTNISAETLKDIEKLRKLLVNKGSGWNELELTANFIGPFLNIVDYYDDEFTYSLFYNRPLTAKVGEYKLTGTVDCLVATGGAEPIQPYFCLHEYKRTLKGGGDPEAQVLSEMLTAAAVNEPNVPIIWGLFVIGKDWQFLTLENNTYALSNTYMAADEQHLIRIYAILCNLKNQIRNNL